VTPARGASVADTDTAIAVTFQQDMDPSSLDTAAVRITDSKYARDLTYLFRPAYDTATRTFRLVPSDAAFRWGTGDGIEVTLLASVRYANGQPLGAAYGWSFAIP
jgi:hypothetical protein